MAHQSVGSGQRVRRSMLTANEPSFSQKTKHLRAGTRVNSRVPICVEWEEANARHSVTGWTVDVGAKGCLAIVPQGFAIGQRLRLVNLVNKNSADAVLIWRGHEGRTGWELGLELQDAGEEFWGVDF
jgi:hypothetical protein